MNGRDVDRRHRAHRLPGRLRRRRARGQYATAGQHQHPQHVRQAHGLLPGADQFDRRPVVGMGKLLHADQASLRLRQAYVKFETAVVSTVVRIKPAGRPLDVAFAA